MSTETREGQDCPGCGTTFMPDKGAFRGHKDAMFCPLHRAAPKLLAALKKAWAEADWSGVDGDTMEEVANLIALAEEASE